MSFVDTSTYGESFSNSSQCQQINLYNPVASNGNGSRVTTVLFAGNTAASAQGTLGLLQVAHNGTGADFASIISLYANVGTSGTITPGSDPTVWTATTSAFTLTPPTTINNNLTVTGSSTFFGVTTIQNNLIVTGNLTVSGSLNFGSIAVSGNCTVGGNLGVSGTSTLVGLVTLNTFIQSPVNVVNVPPNPLVANTLYHAIMTTTATWNLPTVPPDGTLMAIVDANNNFATFNQTLHAGGPDVIRGSDATGTNNYTMNGNSEWYELMYQSNSSSWTLRVNNNWNVAILASNNIWTGTNQWNNTSTLNGAVQVNNNLAVTGTLVVTGNSTFNGLTTVNTFIQTPVNVANVPPNPLVANTLYHAIMTGTATWNLPNSPPDGTLIAIVDANNNFATFNQTLHGGGTDAISGSDATNTTTYIMNGNSEWYELMYQSNSKTWTLRVNNNWTTAILASNNIWTGTNQWNNTSTFNGAVQVNNNLAITGTLVVTGTATFNGVTTINNNFNVTGNLVVTGTSTLNGVVTVNNNVGITGTLTVTGNSTLVGAVTALNNLGVSGNLTVTGTSTHFGLTTVNTFIQTPVNVANVPPNPLVANTLYHAVMTGTATWNLPTSPPDGTLIAIVDANNNFATFNQTLHGGGTDAIAGSDATGTGTYTMNGNSEWYELMYQSNSKTWTLRVNNNWNVAVLASNNIWTGTNQWNNTSTFNGSVQVNNNLAVTGTLVVTGTSTLNGVTTINNNLNVTGQLTVSGVSTFNLGVLMNSTLAVVSNLTVSGTLLLLGTTNVTTTSTGNIQNSGGFYNTKDILNGGQLFMNVVTAPNSATGNSCIVNLNTANTNGPQLVAFANGDSATTNKFELIAPKYMTCGFISAITYTGTSFNLLSCVPYTGGDRWSLIFPLGGGTTPWGYFTAPVTGIYRFVACVDMSAPTVPNNYLLAVMSNPTSYSGTGAGPYTINGGNFLGFGGPLTTVASSSTGLNIVVTTPITAASFVLFAFLQQTATTGTAANVNQSSFSIEQLF